jgi:hypothetical protein
MSMPQKQTISDLLLEQYALGVLAADAQKRVDAELARDETLRARLAALRESDREIRAAYPAERIVPAIREKLLRTDGTPLRAARPRRVNPLAWALPVAAMVVLLVSFFVLRERIAPSETRLKGLTAHLAIFRKTATGAEELGAGSLARRADVLHLGYTAGEARYGVIFSVDGRGTITWHMPGGYANGPRPAPALDQQGPVMLPAAYELDDAPGFERFFLVYGAAPFDVAAVAGAARALASRPAAAESDALGLPAGLAQYSLLVKKQGR